jgi:hypothetical protein
VHHFGLLACRRRIARQLIDELPCIISACSRAAAGSHGN